MQREAARERERDAVARLIQQDAKSNSGALITHCIINQSIVYAGLRGLRLLRLTIHQKPAMAIVGFLLIS